MRRCECTSVHRSVYTRWWPRNDGPAPAPGPPGAPQLPSPAPSHPAPSIPHAPPYSPSQAKAPAMPPAGSPSIGLESSETHVPSTDSGGIRETFEAGWLGKPLGARVERRLRGLGPLRLGGCPQPGTAEHNRVAIAMANVATNLTAFPPRPHRWRI